MTLFLSLVLLAMPLIIQRYPGLGLASPFECLIPVIAGVEQVLPALAKPWLEAFKNTPERLAVLGLAIVGLLLVSNALQTHIGDVMRWIWHCTIAGTAPPPPPWPKLHDFLCWLRAWPYYRGLFYALTHWILPTFFALVIGLVLLYGGFVLVSRLLFAGANVTGFVCRGSAQTQEIVGQAPPVRFDTQDLCRATGLTLRKHAVYRVTLQVTDPWEDGYNVHQPSKGIATDPNGFGQERATRNMAIGLPIRRLVASNWFQMVVRVGSGGRDEQPLQFVPAEDRASGGHTRSTVLLRYAYNRIKWRAVFFCERRGSGLPKAAGLLLPHQQQGQG